MELTEISRKAKETSRQTGKLDTETKNMALLAAADALVQEAGYLTAENEKDLLRARENGMPEGPWAKFICYRSVPFWKHHTVFRIWTIIS